MTLRNLVEKLRQPGRFLLVGGGATLLDLAVFSLLIYFFREKASVCFVVAFGLSVCCRFLADKNYTFRNTGNAYFRQFALYITGCCLTLGVGMTVFTLGLQLGASELWSKLVSIPFVTVVGYLFFRLVVFRQ